MEIEMKDFEKIELKVGEIIKVDEIAGSDKLYRLEVDVGGRQITLVAGIKKNYKREKLAGKKIVVVTNLRPTTIKGVTSEGMLLAAVKNEDVKLVTIDGDIEIGSDVA
jgi:methionyl-tRNA synthetase